MRKTAGVLVLILGAVTVSALGAEYLDLGDDTLSSWLWFALLWAPSIICSIFTFRARYWKLCLILAILFGGIIPAFLIYQSRSDWKH